MTHPVRLAVIGAGQIAHFACGEFARHPDARVVAACDPSAARVGELAAKFDIPRTALTAQPLFEASNVDAVYIATPNAFHAPLALAALEQGKHVLLEKPFAMNAIEAERVVATARERGRLLTLGMSLRFIPAAQTLQRLVREGLLGDVYHAKAHWFRRAGIPRLGTWFGKKSLSGGGALLDIGVHLLDLALFLMDDFNPTVVMGCTDSRFGARGLGEGGWGMSDASDDSFDVDDFATALVRFQSGKSLTLDAAWALHQSEADRKNVLLHGSEAGAGCFPAELYRFGAPGEAYRVEPAPDRSLGYPHLSVFHNFVGAVLGREELCVLPEQALVVQRVLDAIYESSRTSAAVTLPNG